MDSFFAASSYVKIIEERQGIMISCLEEIAWRNQWITNQDLQKLTKEEIQFLLSMIKQSTFQGEAVEMLYKLVLKLQNQYLNIK